MQRITIFILVLSFTITKAISQDTLILQPGPEGKDAIINDYYEGNYGDYPNLFAIAGTASGDPFTTRSLLEFDLSSIPPGSAILEARLSLYFANNPDNPYYHYGENQAYLQRVIEPWEEYIVTWWNQPQSTGQNQVSLPVSQYEAQDYTDIDVKDLIQDIINDPENSYGILLKLQVEEIYRRMFFASGDHENPLLWPKLEIIHMGCPIPTAGFEYLTDSLTLSFTGISPTAITWHWDFGDGDTSDVQNPEHYYQEPGFYNVCLRVEDTCYFAEYCEEIEICTAPPVAGFTFTTEVLAVFFQDASVMAAEYYWDFGDGYFSNLANPTHTYDMNGTYEVCLTIWNDCGADTICQMLHLSTVNIDEHAEELITIYPNPARDEVFLKSTFSGTGTLSICDLSGKYILREDRDFIKDEIQRISLVQTPPGIYILRIDSAKKIYFSKLAVIH